MWNNGRVHPLSRADWRSGSRFGFWTDGYLVRVPSGSPFDVALSKVHFRSSICICMFLVSRNKKLFIEATAKKEYYYYFYYYYYYHYYYYYYYY